MGAVVRHAASLCKLRPGGGEGQSGVRTGSGRDRARTFQASTVPALLEPMPDSIELPGRVRAPDFPESLDWINTGGRRLSLADFRGKLLFLDFWTYG